MQVKSNLKKDRFFLRLVEVGRLTVTKKGVITNARTGRVIGKNKSSYVRISYQHPKTKKIYNMLAHRLVWIVFNGLIEDPSIEVNHKDGNKRNNRLSNLELVTQSGNGLHAYATGLNCAAGENNSQSLFSDRQVRILRRKFAAGRIDLTYITDKYECHALTARQMIEGDTYCHLAGAFDIPKKQKATLVGKERIVLKLAAKGLSNTAIASELSERGIQTSRSAVQRCLATLQAA